MNSNFPPTMLKDKFHQHFQNNKSVEEMIKDNQDFVKKAAEIIGFLNQQDGVTASIGFFLLSHEHAYIGSPKPFAILSLVVKYKEGDIDVTLINDNDTITGHDEKELTLKLCKEKGRFFVYCGGWNERLPVDMPKKGCLYLDEAEGWDGLLDKVARQLFIKHSYYGDLSQLTDSVYEHVAPELRKKLQNTPADVHAKSKPIKRMITLS